MRGKTRRLKTMPRTMPDQTERDAIVIKAMVVARAWVEFLRTDREKR